MIDILLIEDNPADVLLCEAYVDGSDLVGSSVTAVGTMREAEQQVAAHAFDVVLLDLSLPDCQRQETLRRAKQAFAGLPVVVLSGTGDLQLAKASVQEGIQDYLVKDHLNEWSLARSVNYAIERNKLINDKAAAERNLVERNHYLEIANRRLEQFAYTVSHNLRAPLARILGLSQVIRHQPLDPEASDLVNLIEESAQGLDGTIRDLMQLLVIQKDINQNMTHIDVAQLLNQVIESLSVQIRTSGAVITPDFETLRGVMYSEPILQSVLLNLLTNAIRYRAEHRRLRVKVALRPLDDQWCCLSVSDNGRGIDLTRAGRQLFQLFARFHDHTEGKGIGLYMIKSLVEDSGGRIEVASTPDVGSTFSVYFRNHVLPMLPKDSQQTVDSQTILLPNVPRNESEVT